MPKMFDLVPATPKNWLQYRHPSFKAYAKKWVFANHHYTGDCLSEQLIGSYLIKRAMGETEEAYHERRRLADYTNHFSALVDGLAGLLFANEDDATRVFRSDQNEGLGDLTIADSPIARLWQDIDGEGTSWMTAHKRLAVDLIVYQMMWGIVTSPDGQPRARYLPPTMVLNWREETPGQVVEALVVDLSDSRGSIRENVDDMGPRFLHYTIEGWTTWTESDDGKPVQLTGEGNSGTYRIVDRWDRPVTPLFQVPVPLRRYVGWLMAVKQNSLFNLENARDYLQWIGSFPKLNLVADDTAFIKLSESLREGASVLQDDPKVAKSHSYINPPTENAKALTETLTRKVEEFYVTAGREYSNVQQERRTATEVRQDTASGVGAFVQLLKASMDDAENQALGRIAQVLFPEDQSRWFVARVERSAEVVPLDVNTLIEKLITRTYGRDKPVPWGRTALIDAAMEIARYDGRVAKREEIEAAVDLSLLKDGLEAMREFGEVLPQEAKAMMAIKTLRAVNGILPKVGESIEAAERRLVEDAIAEMETRKAEEQARAEMELEARTAA